MPSKDLILTEIH